MRWGGAVLAFCLCLAVCLLVVALRTERNESRARLRMHRERTDWARAHAAQLRARRLLASSRTALEARYRELCGLTQDGNGNDRHAQEQ